MSQTFDSDRVKLHMVGQAPDDRIDDLITDVRGLSQRLKSITDLQKLTFNHVLQIEGALRANGIQKARPWKDLALVLSGMLVCAFFLAACYYFRP